MDLSNLPVSWVTDPDKVTFALWVLAGSVILLGRILVSGAKKIVEMFLARLMERLDSVEHKLDRVATSLESLTLTTAVDIAEIRSTCKATHNR